jgi:hypothetical protein
VPACLALASFLACLPCLSCAPALPACPACLCSVQPEGPHKAAELIDSDGLPHIGAAIWPGQPYTATMDKLTGVCLCVLVLVVGEMSLLSWTEVEWLLQTAGCADC